MGSRECRCTCDGFAMVLRVCSFLAHAGTGAAAGWGFLIANERFKLEAGAAALSTDVVKSLSSLNQSFAFFQGIMATYYCIFAVLGMMSEIRSKWMRSTVLKHLNFLTSYFGRGCFMIYIGSIFVSIPWEINPDRKYVSYVPGALEVAFGVLQLLFFIFVKKDARLAGSPTGAGAPKEGGWHATSAVSAQGGGGEDGIGMPSPTRQQLLVGVSGPPAFANPVHPSNMATAAASMAAAAPVPTDAAGVPVRNPFNG